MNTGLNNVLVRDIIVESKTATNKPTTLEAYHQLKMRDFEETHKNIDSLKGELDTCQGKLIAFNEKECYTDEWRILADRVEAINKEINIVETDDRRLDYFLDVGDMLFQYYDAQASLATGKMDNRVAPAIRMPSNSVLSYFSSPKDASEVKIDTPTKRAMASEIDSTEGLNRDKLLEKYLSVVEPTAIKSGIMPGSGIEPGWGSCAGCGVEMTFFQNEAKLGCPKCGFEEFILIDSEKPSYKDPPREITYFAYKKSNHFNEWLAQFQAKENTDIPNDIIESVLSELRKERIRDPKRVKKEKIREILQKLKLSKMYDHVQQIKNRIQQQMTSLTLSKEIEEKLQHMFKEIQPAFIKYCPKGRSNFLSYPYVLYKMCQLLEMDEFLPCFQLLKSREKLYQQDQVWQQICRELGWQFIRSI